MLATVCFRHDPSPCPGPEPAWFGGRLPERLTVSWAWVWCGWQGNAGGLLRQVLRQRAKRTAQPSGTSHTTLPSSSHGKGLPHLLIAIYLAVLYFTLCYLLFVSSPSFGCLSFSLILAYFPNSCDILPVHSCQLTFPLFLFAPLLFLCTKRDRAAKPRSSQQSQTQTQTQCRRSGCSNVSPGCTDLCPECHTRGQGREVGRRAQAPKEKSKQRCRTQGCDHYANQEKQGYCNECDHFKQIYRG